ncbi:cysteine--tRNA ligase [Candidatus Roizmanbacteria bacterium]|nr:cysteine--tRNA ligase [Candidatus Roizmanbacteria bacterium]
MKLYNTLSRKIEDFELINDKKVLFYHCGPTVYWVQHIGNLRAMTWADLIRRALIYLDYDIKFVRNYTDVGHLTSDQDSGEDKMEKGAKREGITPQQIADKYIAIFENDTKALNIIDPDYKPRASQYIKEMQEMIKTLIEKGFAYVTDLAVIYDVSKFPDYNKLNKQKLDFNQQGAGKGVVEDPEKRHFADFNLWVFKKGTHKNALQTWPSPWGEGFPGWHIECSVMAKSILGETIDIHMGGVEHIPVHHTNEIAQSEAANGKLFVRYWLHNEHLNVDNEKMAKSQGTGFTLKEIVNKGFDAITLRYFFLSAHYRSKQNFTWEALEAAESSLKKLRTIVLDLKANESHETNESNMADFKQQFAEALSNDFQIPQAVAVMWNLVKSNLAPQEKLKLLLDFDKVFGLRLIEVAEEKIPKEIIKLAEERKLARQSKDFKKSDELRIKIEELGFKIEDTDEGYTIKKL